MPSLGSSFGAGFSHTKSKPKHTTEDDRAEDYEVKHTASTMGSSRGRRCTYLVGAEGPIGPFHFFGRIQLEATRTDGYRAIAATRVTRRRGCRLRMLM